MYITISSKIRDIPFLETFLGDRVVYKPKYGAFRGAKGILGWGEKDTASKAKKLAQELNLPYIALEDGFICSFGLRTQGYPPLSLIVDPIGIYYDATKPSLLEHLINTGKASKEDLLEAEKALRLIIEHEISKFNYQERADSSILKGKRSKRILLIDQTYNDHSVLLGMATKKSFLEMLDRALKDNPDADIYIKIHPDVLSGMKKGYLTDVKEGDRIYLITKDVNSISLLKLFDKVYTVSSQMGFEALLLGKPVVCFGMPFYAGWGLTEDMKEIPRRTKKVSLIELFYFSYIKYCRYINPTDGKLGTIFNVIDFILKQREIVDKIGKFNYYCIDFHIARKMFIKPYLKTPKNYVYFAKAKDLIRNSNFREDLSKGKAIVVVWGNKGKKNLLKIVKENIPIYTIEDGFIRSVGLGSEFIPPMSIVIDKRGIYYNPHEESDIEYILNNYNFSEEEIERAKRIRKLIIENRITKYNLENSKGHESIRKIKKFAREKKIILVPGQVEDDESVLLGGGEIKSNIELLYRVRMRNQDSFIIYKPHPDILSKNRRKEKRFKELQNYCDHVEAEADILSCIELADEVHTLTSLSGFDALIRGKKVVTYGAPFYAGWGLTVDELSFPRRKRNLTIEELIAGVLLIYPTYYDWKLRAFADCETIIHRIIEERKHYKSDFKSNLPLFLKKALNYIDFLRKKIIPSTKEKIFR